MYIRIIISRSFEMKVLNLGSTKKTDLKTSFVLDQKGFSIVSVIIAMSMMSLVSLGFASMITGFSQSISQMEDRVNALDIKKLMDMTLSTSTACNNTFRGLPVSAPQTINAIRNTANQPEFSRNQVQNGLVLSNMQLTNIDTPNAANSSGKMRLNLNLNRQGRSSNTALKQQVVYLQVTTDGTARIANCTSISNTSAMDQNARKCMNSPSRDIATRNGGWNDGQTATARRNRSTYNDGYERTYLCVNQNWTLIEDRTISSRR